MYSLVIKPGLLLFDEGLRLVCVQFGGDFDVFDILIVNGMGYLSGLGGKR